ncbi:MAG: zinc-binding dehydrogenase [[Clostridium] scindens]
MYIPSTRHPIKRTGDVQGHEFVGRVEEVSSAVTTIKPRQGGADRCGECYQYEENFNICENYCIGITDNGIQGICGGSLQDVRRCQGIPETAIFAEPLTCVVGAVNKIRLLPGESVLVLGAGPIGLYFTMLLKANGAGKIIVSEPNPKRGEYALKAGADRVINPQEVDLVEEILKETDGHGIDVVAEAVGTLIQEAGLRASKERSCSLAWIVLRSPR